MIKPSLTAAILTFNEEKHLERCLSSMVDVCDEIWVIDSFSTDRTLEIATNHGAKILQHKWTNYATQFNWGLRNCDIRTDWVLRIDADEYLSETLGSEIVSRLSGIPEDVHGIYVKRLMYFMNKPLKRGGMYPIWHLKLWRTGSAFCEERWMDEHMKLVRGNTMRIEGDLVDHNLNNLTWWTQKHNIYAVREAIDILDMKYNFSNRSSVIPTFFGTQEQRKRWLKLRYLSLPLYTRPFLYWFYRYIIQGGFLEGKRGFVWNFLQAGWYRFLVDAKIDEAIMSAGKDKVKLIDYFKKQYGYDVTQ